MTWNLVDHMLAELLVQDWPNALNTHFFGLGLMGGVVASKKKIQ